MLKYRGRWSVMCSDNRISWKNVAAINLRAIKYAWVLCRKKVIAHNLINLMQAFLDFFNSIYFLGTIMHLIENHQGYISYVEFVSIMLLLNTIRAGVNAYYYYFLSDRYDNELISNSNINIFHKTMVTEFSAYENKSFYDNYYWAAENSDVYLKKIINNLSLIIGYSFLCILVVLSIIRIDRVITIFLLFPIIVSILSSWNAKLNYEKNLLLTPFLRKKQYAKDVIFHKQYAEELRILNIGTIVDDILTSNTDSMIHTKKKYGYRRAVIDFLVQFFSVHLVYLLACLYSLYRILYLKNLSIADFTILITAITTFNSRMSKIIGFCVQAKEHSFYIKKLFDFLDDCNEEEQNGEVAGTFDQINIEEVSFKYPFATKDALKKITLSIKKGNKIAVVGKNGSGKTTLINIILGLYAPSFGVIKYNNVSVHDYNIRSYREKFGVLFQENNIYAATVGENVLLDFYNEEDKCKVVASLLSANFMEAEIFSVLRTEQLLTKEFSDNGVVLSGGQLQKVYIARLYAKEFEIAILDEPSSSLDPMAEYNLYEQMMKVTRNKTVIFVFHRLSSAKLADTIIFLENGRVGDIGSHGELMERCAHYRDMYLAQAQAYRQEGQCLNDNGGY